jgi:hypothetical protein
MKSCGLRHSALECHITSASTHCEAQTLENHKIMSGKYDNGRLHHSTSMWAQHWINTPPAMPYLKGANDE